MTNLTDFRIAVFPGDGMLIDLTETLPDWSVWVSRVGTTSLFFWWFFRSSDQRHAWSNRPKLSSS